MHSFAATAPGRFAGIGRWPARIILLFLLILCIQGLSKAPSLGGGPTAMSAQMEQEHRHVLLHGRLITHVRGGEDYYAAAAREHREHGQTLGAISTVRLPTLAYLFAPLPPFAPVILLYMLGAGALAAWAWRLSLGGLPIHRAALGAALLLAGAGTLLLPDLVLWHECWAALLIALSLAFRGSRRYGAAVASAFAAAAIREQAILYAITMLAFALKERRAGETLAWITAILLAGSYLAWHAGHVAALAGSGGAAVPEWSGTGGWKAAILMVHVTGPLTLMPAWVSAVAVPLALIGWACWPSAHGARGTAFLCLYMLLLAAAARTHDTAWALLIVPLLPVGLLFAPRALADLARAALAPAPGQAEPASLST